MTSNNFLAIKMVIFQVMRVIIFDQMGNVLNKFGCSKHLEFPNGVVVNDRQEIFISDNRAHCVKVFDYEGNFLRQIGGEGNGDNIVSSLTSGGWVVVGCCAELSSNITQQTLNNQTAVCIYCHNTTVAKNIANVMQLIL